MKCSCMRAGMSCVSACSVCCGHCSNGVDVEEVDSDEEEMDITYSKSYNQIL